MNTSAPVLFAIALLSVSIAQAEQVSAKPSPNILMILVDDLGYGDLSSYGAKDLKTPRIDDLIDQGLRFDNFYANCPVCSPTRASLLTGRYPDLVGVPGVIRTHAADSWGYLHPDATLLPQVLSRAGYDTACIGKWHLGLDGASHPVARGFDFFHGFLGDMMDDYFHHRRHGVNYMRRQSKTIEPTGHATELFSDWACDYISERSADAKPFFLYLAYNAPHTPIQPPDDWLQKVKDRDPKLAPQRAKLVALIEHLDANIGRVLDCLAKTDTAKRETVIVFTSDNGGQLNVGANNGPLRDGKQSMYEGGLKVPTGIVWPSVIKPQSRTQRVGLTMDLFPTLCELAGAAQHSKTAIDGISLLPTLRGEAQQTADRPLFFHRREGGLRYGGLTVQAVRLGDWKLLQNSPFAAQELYNLKDDPLEQINRAADRRTVYEELAAKLRRQSQRGGAVPWQPRETADAN